MKIYLGISTYNRKDLLERCLNSLKGSIQYIDKLIVVDNGSQGIQHDFIDKLIWNESNLGYAGGTNQIIKEAKDGDADWVFILNDDITVYPGFLERMLPLLALCKNKWLLTPDWEWACITFSKEGIKNLEFKPDQWLDEQFWPGYYSDNDLHHRIKCTGKESEIYIGKVPELTPWIKEKSKTKELAPELNHEKATPLYIQKWGGLPGKELYSMPYNNQLPKVSSTLKEMEVPRGWNTLLPLPSEPLISMVVVAYQRPVQIKVLLNSFLAQTYQNFEILVYHDGPGPDVEKAVLEINDQRIIYKETDHRYNDYGHTLRELGSKLVKGAYIGHSNDDNYYAPVYFEWMLHGLLTQNAQFAYCNMIHSHQQWRNFETQPAGGMLDAGGWIAERSLVINTQWPNKDFCADGDYINAMISTGCRTIKIPGYLFIHN